MHQIQFKCYNWSLKNYTIGKTFNCLQFKAYNWSLFSNCLRTKLLLVIFQESKFKEIAFHKVYNKSTFTAMSLSHVHIHSMKLYRILSSFIDTLRLVFLYLIVCENWKKKKRRKKKRCKQISQWKKNLFQRRIFLSSFRSMFRSFGINAKLLFLQLEIILRWKLLYSTK